MPREILVGVRLDIYDFMRELFQTTKDAVIQILDASSGTLSEFSMGITTPPERENVVGSKGEMERRRKFDRRIAKKQYKTHDPECRGRFQAYGMARSRVITWGSDTRQCTACTWLQVAEGNKNSAEQKD